MKNKRKKLKDILNEDELMLTEEDVNMEEFSCLLPRTEVRAKCYMEKPILLRYQYKPFA